MKHIILSILITCLGVSTAQAACYADYKAKRDDPLRLHYGVARISGDCDKAAAEAELRERLRADNWQLLNVLGVFDDAGLEDRKESAGDYFLRY